MEYSVREAKAHFAQAASIAASGERVVITKHGVPFVELVPVQTSATRDAAVLAAARAALGLGDDNADWFDDFISNPQASRRALGLDD